MKIPPFYSVLSQLQENTFRQHNSQSLIPRAPKLLWERNAGWRLRRDYFLQRFNTRLRGFTGNRIMHMAVSLRELWWPQLLGVFKFHPFHSNFSLSPSRTH